MKTRELVRPSREKESNDSKWFVPSRTKNTGNKLPGTDGEMVNMQPAGNPVQIPSTYLCPCASVRAVRYTKGEGERGKYAKLG